MGCCVLKSPLLTHAHTCSLEQAAPIPQQFIFRRVRWANRSALTTLPQPLSQFERIHSRWRSRSLFSHLAAIHAHAVSLSVSLALARHPGWRHMALSLARSLSPLLALLVSVWNEWNGQHSNDFFVIIFYADFSRLHSTGMEWTRGHHLTIV